MKMICLWPDGMWCNIENIDEYYWKSDDFILIEISDDIEDIDEYLLNMEI